MDPAADPVLADELRLSYPAKWETPPDRYVQLWRSKNGLTQGGVTERITSNDVVCPPGQNCRNCYTLKKGGVGKGNAKSVRAVGVTAYLYNKDDCRTGTRFEAIPEGTYISDLSSINFGNNTNSVRLDWHEDDKLPCCFGVTKYLDKRMCDRNLLNTDKHDPTSPCYNPIKLAIAQDPENLQYQVYRDWCRRTGDCDDAMEDYCYNNPDDPICGCLSSTMEGGLAVCADERCANRAAYRTKNMRSAETACPDVQDCRQYLTQEGSSNIVQGSSQDQVCQIFKNQGKLGEIPTTPSEPPATPSPTPSPSPSPSPYPPMPPMPPMPPIASTQSSWSPWMYALLVFIVAVLFALWYFSGNSSEVIEKEEVIAVAVPVEMAP